MLASFKLYNNINMNILREKLQRAPVDKPFKCEPKYKLDWDELKGKLGNDDVKQFYL